MKVRSARKSADPKPAKPCPVCKQPFKTQGRLANHLTKAHPDYTPPAE